ncbi:MAG: phosphate ABC transporter substrate-binding protein, PhoT family [Alphaproteobacteria bacterium]|nr:MAG: phosphate ABC transporter substrate-binding protein, PhoT family [Alphaproteobacteria bacterium]
MPRWNGKRAVFEQLARSMRAIPAILALLILTGLHTGCDRNRAEPAVDREALAGPLHAADGKAGAKAGGMVQWLAPALPVPAARSEEEKQRDMELGREPPEPELLQPSLDQRLPDFKPRLDPSVSAHFIGGASDVLPGLVKRWLHAFRDYYPNVVIDISTPYAGSLGMLDVIAGKYDFVFVSRELKPTDIAAFREKYGYAPFTVAVSGGTYRHYGFLDAIGFFVNVHNPIDRLTLDQIDALFSSTRHRGGVEIRKWGDLGLGGEWADMPVHLYGIRPWNGFEEFVRQRVLDSGNLRGEWREDIQFSPHAFEVAEQVANDPLGIGYTGLAYLNWPVKVLPLASGPDSTAFIAPSYENVASADYPLSRLVYFNANKAPDKELAPVLDEFLRFILSVQGQQVVLDHAIYLPLRQPQVQQALLALDTPVSGKRNDHED